MIKLNYVYCIGDMFTKHADCFVNAVNCVGIQGAGIALDFKKRFPKAYKEYKELCEKNILNLYEGGSLHIDSHASVNGGKECYIYQFPTMYRPGEKSSLDTIKIGMIDLVETINIHDDINSISIPPLGCGIGRLNKSDVEKIIKEEILDNISVYNNDRNLTINLWNF